MDKVSRNGAIDPILLYALSPSALLSSFARCFLSCILVSCISRPALYRAIVHILVLPIWFAGLACRSCFVVPEGEVYGQLAVLALGFPDLLFSSCAAVSFVFGAAVFEK